MYRDLKVEDMVTEKIMEVITEVEEITIIMTETTIEIEIEIETVMTTKRNVQIETAPVHHHVEITDIDRNNNSYWYTE